MPIERQVLTQDYCSFACIRLRTSFWKASKHLSVALKLHPRHMQQTLDKIGARSRGEEPVVRSGLALQPKRHRSSLMFACKSRVMC